MPTSSRRHFLQYASAATAAAVFAAPTLAWARPRRRSDTRLRVLSIGVIGTIGEHDRHTIAKHPDVDIVGLCDVDSNALAKAASGEREVGVRLVEVASRAIDGVECIASRRVGVGRVVVAEQLFR